MGLQVPVNLPAGSISPYAGAVAPAGWLLMYGQAVSRVTYGALFLAIGTAYGVGDGSTTFNLPDVRGRALFGRDDMGGASANRLTTGGGGVNGAALGAVGGGQSVTLLEGEMPNHNHSLTGYSGFNLAGGTSVSLATVAGGNPTTSSKGSSSAHANIPPALVINYIIKV